MTRFGSRSSNSCYFTPKRHWNDLIRSEIKSFPGGHTPQILLVGALCALYYMRFTKYSDQVHSATPLFKILDPPLCWCHSSLSAQKVASVEQCDNSPDCNAVVYSTLYYCTYATVMTSSAHAIPSKGTDDEQLHWMLLSVLRLCNSIIYFKIRVLYIGVPKKTTGLYFKCWQLDDILVGIKETMQSS